MVRKLVLGAMDKPKKQKKRKHIKGKESLIIWANLVGKGRYFYDLIGKVRLKFKADGGAYGRFYPYIPLRYSSAFRLRVASSGEIACSGIQEPQDNLEFGFKVRGGYVGS